MKRYMFAALVIALLGLASWAQAAVVFTENFEYDAGVLGDSTGQANVSGGVWHHFSGTGSLIQCVDGNLSYANYQASNIGKMMRIYVPSGSAEDLCASFTAIPTGTPVYAAFLLNVLDTLGIPRDTSAGGEYFVAMLPSNSYTMYAPRMVIRLGAGNSNSYVLGIRPSGTTTPVWNSSTLAPATTHLIVIRHVLVAGAANDTSSVFIDPDMTQPEPTPTFTNVATGADTTNDIGRFAVRQNRVSNSSRTPNANIDGIVVGTSWHDITGVMGSPAAVTASSFKLQAARPNPVQSMTTLQYSLPVNGAASLAVFNVVGQKVATLASGVQTAGMHQVRWTLRDDQGNLVPNGIYFYQLTTGTSKETRKLTVVR